VGGLIEVLSAHDGVSEDLAAGVLDGAARGQAPGQSCDADVRAAQERADIQGGAVAFHVRVGGHHDFLDRA